jgi:hypothetical protein
VLIIYLKTHLSIKWQSLDIRKVLFLKLRRKINKISKLCYLRADSNHIKWAESRGWSKVQSGERLACMRNRQSVRLEHSERRRETTERGVHDSEFRTLASILNFILTIKQVAIWPLSDVFMIFWHYYITRKHISP